MLSFCVFGLVGIFHVPLPAGYFSAFSSWLDCCVWSGLSVFWWSVFPFYCGGFSQGVGLDGWLVKVSWLGKLALLRSGVWNWISSLSFRRQWSAFLGP